MIAESKKTRPGCCVTQSPNQTLQAARNTHLPSMTHGAKLRQAQQHVRLSQTQQSPLAAGFINHLADDVTGVTGEV